MSYSNLRSAERISLRVPLRFRPAAGAPRDLFEGETVNVSEKGLFFVTNHPPQFGAPLDLIVLMPGDTRGESSTPVRCRARVVRVQDIPAANQAGVAVTIEYFRSFHCRRRKNQHRRDESGNQQSLRLRRRRIR